VHELPVIGAHLQQTLKRRWWKHANIFTSSQQVLLNCSAFFFNWYSGGWSPNWVHSALRPPIVLLCQPRVIMMMKKLVEWWLAGETEVLGENLPPCRFVHHKPHMPARRRTRAAAVGSQLELWHGLTASLPGWRTATALQHPFSVGIYRGREIYWNIRAFQSLFLNFFQIGAKFLSLYLHDQLDCFIKTAQLMEW
jgi:hypothetical protein